jgi:hypothetical protein
MTTQYTTILKLALPVQGELSGTWGDVVNDNITQMVEQAVAGKAVVNTWTANSHTLTTADGTTSESRCAILELTDSGTALTGAGTVVCPTNTKLYIVDNNTAEIITVQTAAGTGVAVPVGKTMLVYCDGTNVVEGVTHANSLSLGTSTVTADKILDEDNMASDSATAIATQQSIKAYVDSQVGTVDTLSEILANGNTTGANDIDVDSAQKVQFRDAAIYINSSVDGQLDIVADGEVQIDTALVDINGNLDVSGTTNISGSVSFTKNAIAGVAISTTSRSSNTVTVTTSAVHGLTSGDLVNVNGVADTSFNGYFTVSVSSTTVFTYNQTGSDGSSTGGTSTEVVYNLNASGTALNWMNGPLNIAANSGIDGLEITQSGAGNGLHVTGTTGLVGNTTLTGNLDVSGTTLVTGVLTTTAATVFNGGFASNADSTLGTDKKVQFRDAAIYLNSSVDGQLDIVADTEIQIAATTIDVNGTLAFDSLKGTGATTVTNILDEDNMASDSATAIATQQSIKAYVDSQVGSFDTLAEVLAQGNTTGGTDLAVSTGDDITFADSSKAIFGAGSDLQIYHNGSNSYIEDAGTGSLIIRASTATLFQGKTAGESQLTLAENGAVTAYYDNAAKLATSATGIDVTGSVTATTATGSASPTPTKITIATSTSASDWSTTAPWGRLAFYSADTSAGGAKEEVTLDVVAAQAAGGVSDFTINTYNSGAKERLRISYDGDVSFYEDTGTTPKFVWSATNERLTLTGSDYQFGIQQGANQPWYTRAVSDGTFRLHINGTGDIITASATGIDVTGTVTADGLTVEGSSTGTLSVVNFLNTDTSANATANRLGLGISNSAGTNYTYIEAKETGVDAYAEMNFYTGSTTRKRLTLGTDGDISFYEDTGTTPKFFWDASEERLGIGTSSPDYLLEVEKANGDHTSTAISVTNSQLGGYGSTLNFISTRTDTSAHVVAARLRAAGNDSWNSDASTDSNLYFATVSANTLDDRMTILHNGNVGIGTDSPAIGGGRTYNVALTIDGGVSGGAEDTGALEVGGSTSVNDRLVGSISYFNRDNSGADATTRRQVAIIEAKSVTSDSNAGDDSGANLTFSTKSEGGSVAERMRILADGSVVQGNTVSLVASNYNNQAGAAWHEPDGHYEIATTSDVAPLQIGKNNATDGSLLVFRKQSDVVGSIGSISGVVSYINLDPRSGGTGIAGTNTDSIIPVTGTGAVADGTKDLGLTTARWRNLYLSGGVVFGATGGAVTSKTLDDYEEGTWTPTITNSTGSYTTQVGRYTKIGNLVYVNCNVNTAFTNTGTTSQDIGGLPFTSENVGSLFSVGTVFPVVGFNQGNSDIAAQATINTTSVALYTVAPTTGINYTRIVSNTFGTTVEFEFSLCYRAA